MPASAAGSLSSPASAMAASPGSSFCSEKISTDTKNSVGISTVTRRATKAASCIAQSVQLEPPETDDPVGVGREARDLRAVAREHAAVPEGQAREVAHQVLGRLVVELLALGGIGRLTRLREQRVHRGVA